MNILLDRVDRPSYMDKGRIDISFPPRSGGCACAAAMPCCHTTSSISINPQASHVPSVERAGERALFRHGGRRAPPTVSHVLVLVPLQGLDALWKLLLYEYRLIVQSVQFLLSCLQAPQLHTSLTGANIRPLLLMLALCGSPVVLSTHRSRATLLHVDAKLPSYISIDSSCCTVHTVPRK